MEIIKTVVTTLDVLIILLLFLVGREMKDKPAAIGFGRIIVLLIANIFLMWR